MKQIKITILALAISATQTACIGTTVDVVIEVVKVPFKVAGAVVDVVTDDDDEKSDK